VERQERHHRGVEVLDVLRLGLLATNRVLLFAFGELRCCPLGVEFRPDSLHHVRDHPEAAREHFSATLFGHGPGVGGGLDTAGEAGVTGRQQHPPGGNSVNRAVSGTDGVRGRAGGEEECGWHLVGIGQMGQIGCVIPCEVPSCGDAN
jgi:hypothetical protein